MPRPRRCRIVGLMPGVTYFKPAGVRMTRLNEVVLTVGEFEAVRLKDLEGMDQEKAAVKMRISQPTFHRLVLSARKKISEALVHGKAIKIQGGNFKMVQPRRGMGRGGGRGMGFGGPASACKCSKCSYEEPKVRGVPCTSKKCPKCGAMMIRGK